MILVPCLIVDDLEENLVALAALLSREGLLLLKARSGREALEILLKQEVALALVDVQMPEMDGFELAELMRGTERTRRVPIIFLTAGKADRQRKFRGYEAGAVDFLEKPIEPDILRSKSEVFFELYRQREELRAAADRNATLLAESRRAEEAARQSEARLRLALEASATGLWTWDIATDAMTWSPECNAILGVPEGGFEGTGAAFFRLVHPDDRGRVEATLRAAISARRPYECDFRVLRPGGSIAWVMNRGRADYSPRGELVRMLGTISDVTDRKDAEMELARLNAALVDTDRRKDEFLATLAHELRNPLAPMRSSLAVLSLAREETAASAEAREVLERQIAHMVHLIDDLMDAARIGQGKIELRRERVEVHTLLEHAVEASQAHVAASRHTLVVDLPTTPLWLDADRIRLSQVVSNLLINAAKYTPEGGEIRLGVEADSAEVIVRVSDNGAGLSPEKLHQVFDLFTQVEGTLERSQGGLGIGLAVVRKLVELHGGVVEASSPGVGKGSTFTVRLPRAEPPVEAPPAPAEVRPPTSSPQGSYRVLVVDDNVDSARSLARLLGLRGHDARVAHDGPDALDIAGAYRPHLILLDIGLPGMDGLQVCERLRDQPELAGVTIVALTGWGTEGARQRAQKAGFDEHMLKPVDLADLERIIRDLRPSEDGSPRS